MCESMGVGKVEEGVWFGRGDGLVRRELRFGVLVEYQLREEHSPGSGTIAVLYIAGYEHEEAGGRSTSNGWDD